jgi:hypothetical protein
MNKFWQEKYQTIQPEPGWEFKPNLNTWETPESQRVLRGEATLDHKNNVNANDVRESYLNPLNILPCGMDLEDPATTFVYGFGGDTDATNNVTTASLKTGFEYDPMAPTDDQYSGEHIEMFYGEAFGDDRRVGFVERNNYLDRQ